MILLSAQQYSDLCKMQTAALLREAAALTVHKINQELRPSFMNDVEVSKVAPALWEAAHSGVIGYGDSPEAACQAFDELWAGVGNGICNTATRRRDAEQN